MSDGTRSCPSWISGYELPCMTLTFPSSASVLSHPWGVCSQEQYQVWDSTVPSASSYQANQRIHSSLHAPYLPSTTLVWSYRSALDPPVLRDHTRRVTVCPSWAYDVGADSRNKKQYSPINRQRQKKNESPVVRMLARAVQKRAKKISTPRSENRVAQLSYKKCVHYRPPTFPRKHRQMSCVFV